MEPSAVSQDVQKTTSTEVERRWLVTLKDQESLLLRYLGTSRHIIQGYADTNDDTSVRIRCMTYHLALEKPAQSIARLTLKSGHGLVRNEVETPLDPGKATEMLGHLRLKLAKRRYYINQFELDVFENELDGLILLEWEYSDDQIKQGLHLQPVEKPEWVASWTEVTDSLSNHHLARLALDRRIAGTDALITLPPKRLPQFVVTGGPGSGKSALMDHIRESALGKIVSVVPEVASLVIGQLGVRPPVGDSAGMIAFQRTLARVQQIFEAESNRDAARRGLKAVILDRGLVDNAAYLDGGLNALAEIVGVSPTYLALPYKGVIVMSTPPEAIYNRIKANNPARSEDYTRARALGELTHALWKRSPSSIPVIHIGQNDSWDDKLAQAMGAFQGFLRQD